MRPAAWPLIVISNYKGKLTRSAKIKKDRSRYGGKAMVKRDAYEYVCHDEWMWKTMWIGDGNDVICYKRSGCYRKSANKVSATPIRLAWRCKTDAQRRTFDSQPSNITTINRLVTVGYSEHPLLSQHGCERGDIESWQNLNVSPNELRT